LFPAFWLGKAAVYMTVANRLYIVYSVLPHTVNTFGRKPASTGTRHGDH
jgi:hypothetical protein